MIPTNILWILGIFESEQFQCNTLKLCFYLNIAYLKYVVFVVETPQTLFLPLGKTRGIVIGALQVLLKVNQVVPSCLWINQFLELSCKKVLHYRYDDVIMICQFVIFINF